MAIAKMNRFTLLTFHDRKQVLLKQLQVFGDVHFKMLGQQELTEMEFLRPDFSPDQLSLYEVELEKVRFSIGKLAPHVEKPKLGAKRKTLTFEEFDRYAAEYDYGAVYDKVKEQDEAIAAIKADIARRRAENDTLGAWLKLDVDPTDLTELRETGYLLGTVNKQVAEEFVGKFTGEFEAGHVELLDTVKDDTSLLLLFPAEQAEEVHTFARELGFTRMAFQLRGMPREVIAENERAIGLALREQEKAEDAIKALAPEHPKLQVALDYFSTVLEREKACQNFLQSDTVVLIEGWVPADDSQKLRAVLDKVCGNEYYLEESAEERDSVDVPIKLKNNRIVRAFTDVTAMYAMPRYNEVDPTPLLTPFYWVFFGMMVGDMGYGLILLIGTTLALKIMDLNEGMKRFMVFFRYLGISTIGAGLLYGSLFGVNVFSPIADPSTETGYRAILDTQYSIVVMLVLSVALGVFHILFGLGIKAYMCFRDGKPFDAFCDGIIWIITVCSAIGWLLGGTGILAVPGLTTISMWVFVACLVGLFLTQGRASPTIGGKIGNGLYGVYGLTSYVGDIVSYTRIVALALAGAYIAYAFNMMTGLVVGEVGSGNIVATVLRLIAGALVAVFGQALNFGLAMLGAYVHTCRLQYVEYFGKFYEGGGVVFRPLSIVSDYVHIKNQEVTDK